MISTKKYLRIPFSRMNCYSLTKKVFEDAGEFFPDIELPKINIHDSACIQNIVVEHKSKWVEIEKPVAPCLVLMKSGRVDESLEDHFAVYIGDNTVLHTTSKSGFPFRFDLNHPFWGKRIVGFYVPKK